MKLSVKEALYEIQITGKISLFEVCILHIKKKNKPQNQTQNHGDVISNDNGGRQWLTYKVRGQTHD